MASIDLKPSVMLLSVSCLQVVICRLDELKGPKHQARLKAVRGYNVDEKTIPLPVGHQKLNIAGSFDPDCYKLTKDKLSRSKAATSREKTILYKRLDFVD